MKYLLFLFSTLFLLSSAFAQIHTSTPGIKMPPRGGSVRALTGEIVGITEVLVNYGRPSVNDREGKIWGELVPIGFFKNPFGNTDSIPWRAGANENTTIEFSTDVFIEGRLLKAGKYGFHIAYHPDSSVLIFSFDNESWGSFYYNEDNDALRVKARPVEKTNFTERLTYSFSNQTDSSVVLSIVWENISIPFLISTELTRLQIAHIEKVMNSVQSFNPSTYRDAARFYYSKNINLDKAYKYASSSINLFNDFYSHYLQFLILNKLNRTNEADSTIDVAIENATKNELKTYGRVLLKGKYHTKALVILLKNHYNDPDDYSNNLDIINTYAALGQKKKALKFANKAIALAPNETVKSKIDVVRTKIKNGS